jgi:hypothetical protein
MMVPRRVTMAKSFARTLVGTGVRINKTRRSVNVTNVGPRRVPANGEAYEQRLCPALRSDDSRLRIGRMA